ncbi:PREDICTED: olfactory receptor 52K2-like [Nanorana parkeri]|uniref:olfactory receptor 52K2-like n=1 Tax=Nanorana parkeri TaxID=125878 RepID=UPI0008541DFC|nr:PREDICTED: olfactory receptor 52K2-like [Nanorana parkeri]
MEPDNLQRQSPAQNISLSYSEFLLFPFPGVTSHRHLLVAPFFSIYIAIVVLNLVISYTVWWEKSLHTPMYVLVALLLALNIIGTTAVIPLMIQSLLGQNKVSLPGCLSQMFFVYSATMFKSVVLLLMAFDRYIAICRPLRYHTIINQSSLTQLWVVGLARNCLLVLLVVVLASRVQYCKSTILNFVCEYGVLLSLACGEVFKIHMVGVMVRMGVTSSDVTVLLVCYVKVLRTALKIAAGSARGKALNTCGNHLLVALIVYSCGILSSILYKVEEAVSYDFQNLSSAIYFLFPALTNPIIYGLRVTEIKDSLMKSWKKQLSVNLNNV